jgi:cytochrome b pre-mRNA-processing protein 3
MPLRWPLFTRGPASIEALYGAIVAQARSAVFYRDYGVPDTVNGRFEMVVLHLVLVLERLSTGHDDASRALGQAVFDLFCQDMDDQLRETGVGDLAVPKRMRQVAGAFYGRQEAYRAALATSDDAALEGALIRNVYAGTEPAMGAGRLAAYMRQMVRLLATQDAGGFGRSGPAWPDLRGKPSP